MRLSPVLAMLALAGCDLGSAKSVPQENGIRTGASFTCTPVKLWDGDGPIHCAEGPKIRLAGIAAREVEWTGTRVMDAGCRDGHPCPDASGVAAREHLAKLLGGKSSKLEESKTGHLTIDGPALSCTANGSAGGSRTAARCSSPRVGDLSCAMVGAGYALRWDRYWRGRSC